MAQGLKKSRETLVNLLELLFGAVGHKGHEVQGQPPPSQSAIYLLAKHFTGMYQLEKSLCLNIAWISMASILLETIHMSPDGKRESREMRVRALSVCPEFVVVLLSDHRVSSLIIGTVTLETWLDLSLAQDLHFSGKK